MLHIYTQWNITQPLKKNELMPFTATWMDPENVILSEVSQTEKEKCHMTLSYVDSKKKWYKWTSLKNRKRLYRLRKQSYDCRGKRIVRESEIDKHTLLYLKWITNKYLLYSTWSSAQCYVAAWMGGKFGRERILIHAWLSHWNYHILISYTPTQNIITITV